MNLLSEFDNEEYYLFSKGDTILCYFCSLIPVEFITNPLNICMSWTHIPSTGAIVFYRPENETFAKEMLTILDKSDYKSLSPEDKCRLMFLLGCNDFSEVELILNESVEPVNQAVSIQGIGPHEGKEYTLMVLSEKKVAYFPSFAPKDFIINPQGIELTFSHAPFWGVIIGKYGYDEYVHELYYLLKKGISSFQASVERRIGEVLGYSDADIDCYIEHWNRG